MAVPTRQTSEADLNQFNAYMRSQPWYQQFFAARGLDPNKVELSREDQAALEKLLAVYGVPVPEGMHIDQAGNLNQKNRLLRNIGIGAAIGGAAATGFGLAGMGPLAGLGGASAAPGLAASAGAPAATEAGIFGSAGALGAGAVPAGIAMATGGGSIWSRLAPQLVGAGIQGLGSVMQSRAANKAAQQQMQASERALDFSKGIYNDQKANQQPYIGMGHSAVNTLGGLMGLSQPPTPQPNTAQPRGPLSSLGGEMVQMRAPDGSVRMVPATQASYLEARGAQRI